MAATARATRPSGASAPLRYAALQLRAVALILDCIVAFSLSLVFFAIGGVQVLVRGDNPPDSAIVIWFGIWALSLFPIMPLFFAWLWSRRGQSVGMMAVRIAVTDSRGRTPAFSRALARSLLWPLSFIPLGIGLLLVFLDPRNRALHDILTGTVVIELP